MLKEQSAKHAVSGLDGIHLPMQETQDAVGSITGAGRSCKVGTGNPLQYSYLENSMDRGAWWAIVHGIAKSRTWLSKNNEWTRLVDLEFRLSSQELSVTLETLVSPALRWGWCQSHRLVVQACELAQSQVSCQVHQVIEGLVFIEEAGVWWGVDFTILV